ncbi:MAG: lysylphosphatidylglycerol synthase transmembrane domain-containing protein [Spirulinaceae cyanobacterium]
MNKKRFISIVVSVAILCIIYSKIDLPRLIAVFQNCDPVWMIISLGMVIPLTLFTSWRLQQLMPAGKGLGFLEANRLILAASVLNMVLPSKMGDIAKAYFMKDRGHLEGSLALSLVIFEKACDMLSLLLWCVFGLLFYANKDTLFWLMTVGVAFGLVIGVMLLASQKFAQIFFVLALKIAPKKIKPKLEKMQSSWVEMHDYFWRDKVQLTKITVTSVFIWFLHLLQIYFFTLAIRAEVPFLVNLALSPLSILAGLLPLTFAGVGTRDAAIILFYQPYMSEAKGAALGLLCTSRYFLPAIGGLPFLGQFLATVKRVKKQSL